MMSEFLVMGGYAAFIWPTYGVAAVLLVGLLVLSLRSMRQREALVDSLRRSRDRTQAETPQGAEVQA